jgi:hypothetical protein
LRRTFTPDSLATSELPPTAYQRRPTVVYRRMTQMTAATIRAKKTGIGMPARRVWPIQLKDSGMPYSVVPSVTMNARPPTVVIVASVATIAEIPR